MSQGIVGKVVRRLAGMPAGVPGYLPTLRRLKSRSVAVVMYHGVLAEEQPWSEWCQLPLGEFAAQIQYLKDHYVVLPLDEVVERIRGGRPLPAATACVTFDDGFRSVATAAAPVLERHQVPATVFLVTGLVGTDQPPWPTRLFHAILNAQRASIRFEGSESPLETLKQREAAYEQMVGRLKRVKETEKKERLAALGEELGWPAVPAGSVLSLMSWDEVERVAAKGLIHFGSHTHTHPILSMCDEEQQRRELRLARDILRERGLSWHLFAYPNGGAGDFTAQTKALLQEFGYHCGLATIPGLNDRSCDLFEVKRVNVGADMTMRQFELRMVSL